MERSALYRCKQANGGDHMADPVYYLPAWLRELGSVAGLFTFAVGAIERVFNGRPQASITIGARGETTLTIHNLSRTSITVTSWKSVPPIFGLARTSSVRSIAGATIGTAFSATVRPEEDLDLILITRSYKGVDHDQLTQRVFLLIFWRRNSSWWWPQFPMWTYVSMAVLNVARSQAGEG
jgi:hypothetical protein